MKIFFVLKSIYLGLKGISGNDSEIMGWGALILFVVAILAAIIWVVNLVAKHIFEKNEDDRQKYMWITGLICGPILIVGILLSDDNSEKEDYEVSYYQNNEATYETEENTQVVESNGYIESNPSYVYQPDQTYNNNYASENNTGYVSEINSGYVSEKTWHECRQCGGNRKCRRCGGEGYLYEYGYASIYSKEKYLQRCPVCNTSGICQSCDGAGGWWY